MKAQHSIAFFICPKMQHNVEGDWMKTKKCTKCGKELTLDMFTKDKQSKDGLLSRCKTCRSLYRKEHSDKDHETQKKYREKNKETLLKRNREYKKENKKNISAYYSEYQKKNVDKFKVYYQKRKARLKQLSCTLTKEQWVNVKSQFDNKCCYCGEKLPLTLEHFIPLTKSGELSRNNVLPACKFCNSSKNNKDFFEWYPKYKYYSKKREKKILDFLGYNDKGQQQLKLG